MSNATTQTAAGPDWYPDPSTPGQVRFWDGSAWTAHVKPNPTTSMMPPPVVYTNQQPLARGRRLANRAAGVAMVGVLLAAIGVVLALFLGTTAANMALVYSLVIGGAIVFAVALVLCTVFTILRR